MRNNEFWPLALNRDRNPGDNSMCVCAWAFACVSVSAFQIVSDFLVSLDKFEFQRCQSIIRSSDMDSLNRHGRIVSNEPMCRHAVTDWSPSFPTLNDLYQSFRHRLRHSPHTPIDSRSNLATTFFLPFSNSAFTSFAFIENLPATCLQNANVAIRIDFQPSDIRCDPKRSERHRWIIEKFHWKEMRIIHFRVDISMSPGLVDTTIILYKHSMSTAQVLS